MKEKTFKNSPAEIYFSGKSSDVGFIIGILKRDCIPYRQALAFKRGAIIRVPIAYDSQLKAILEKNSADRVLYLMSPSELESSRTLLWIMGGAVVGILSIAWGRVLLHLFIFRR